MLFQVEMRVALPRDMDPAEAEALIARERTMAQELQRRGTWRHLWRVAGAYANLSLFDVSGNAELHEVLSAVPLFPHMTIGVTPLLRHPSSIHDDDR